MIKKLSKELISKGHSMIIPHTNYISQSEADLISVTKSGYWNEYEIKRSRQDFLAEIRAFNGDGSYSYAKYEKHDKIRKCKNGGNNNKIPNKFWLVTPPDLVEEKEIPDYWGHYIIDDYDVDKNIKASWIHKEKVNFEFMYRVGVNITKRYWGDKHGVV